MNKTELDKKCDNCHFRLMMAETVEQLAGAKARHETLAEAVKKIAEQPLLTEMTADNANDANFIYAYDALIEIARLALKGEGVE